MKLKEKTAIFGLVHAESWHCRAILAALIKRALTMSGRFCRYRFFVRVMQSVRIESANRMSSVASRAAVGRYAGGQAFSLAGISAPARPSAASPVMPLAALDAILALQGVGDALTGRRRAVRRGASMLDVLETVKADLLVGKIAPERLDALVDQLQTMRDRVEPGLDEVIDEIELRVRVELAKLGRFPSL
jgi:hypothetical protein